MTYADSSFLVSLYIQDSNTEAANKHLSVARSYLLLTNFSKFEAEHAVRCLAFRKLITIGEMTQGLIHFERGQTEGVFEFRKIESDDLFRKAAQLSNRHAVEHGVRYLDMLHVASALLANATRFLTFDLRQRKFAQAVGLDVKI